jgi:hypothetical protein
MDEELEEAEAEYRALERELREFYSANAEAYAYLEGLLERIRIVTERCEQLSRATKRPVGPVVLGGTVTRVSSRFQVWASRQSPEMLKRLGVVQETQYKVGVAELRKAVQAGHLSQSVLEELTDTSTTVRVPEVGHLPRPGGET